MVTYHIKFKGSIIITAKNEEEALQIADNDLQGFDIDYLDVEQMTEDDDYDPYEN